MPTIVYVHNTKRHLSRIVLTKHTYGMGTVPPSCMQINKVVQILGRRMCTSRPPWSSLQEAFIYAHPWSNNYHSLCHTSIIVSIKNVLWAYIQRTSYLISFQYLIFVYVNETITPKSQNCGIHRWYYYVIYVLHMWSPFFGHYLLIYLYVCIRGFNKE